MCQCKSKDNPRWYNQPLPVGIAVLIGTFLFQYFGWKYQQQFIAEQSRAAAATALAQSTMDEVTKAVSSELTAAASYVAAHATRMKKPQLDDTIDQYNKLQEDWDLGEDLLKARMRRWFSSQPIETRWKAILDQLGALDAAVNGLIDFRTDDAGPAHQQQIQRCKTIIAEIEKALGELNRLMTDQLTVAPPS
jgi:hypothetical protein